MNADMRLQLEKIIPQKSSKHRTPPRKQGTEKLPSRLSTHVFFGSRAEKNFNKSCMAQEKRQLTS